ncbi:MAG: YbaN family protein [Defluviitaleaceae bacterium]|nr:YbaN family protein [Defluviitaleaceae bacterium]
MNKIAKSVYVVVGFIFLGIGIVGAFLPVLPSVKFFLIASFCFVKGSKRFDKWFKGTAIYQKYLADYVRSKGMTLKQKWTILLTASAMLAFPLIRIDVLPMRIFLIVLVICKYVGILVFIKTL